MQKKLQAIYQLIKLKFSLQISDNINQFNLLQKIFKLLKIFGENRLVGRPNGWVYFPFLSP